MSWRDQDVPGGQHLTPGAPLTSPRATSPAPLRGMVTQAVSHERTGTVAVSNRTRAFLITLGLLNVITGMVLYAFVRPENLGWVGDLLSWGGNWWLVSTVCCLAGAALLVLAILTDWFREVSRDHLYATWGAVAVSVPSTGLALAVLALTIVLGLIFGAIIMGMIWAAVSGE